MMIDGREWISENEKKIRRRINFLCADINICSYVLAQNRDVLREKNASWFSMTIK